ncbi:Beta-xylanase, partial [Operophtera brumata]
YYYAALNDEDTQELEIVTEEPKLKRRKSNDSLDLLFGATTRKLLSSTVSQGLRADGNAFLINADKGTRSTHLVRIEVYNLLKINKIPPKEYWKHADFKIKFYANAQDDAKLYKKLRGSRKTQRCQLQKRTTTINNPVEIQSLQQLLDRNSWLYIAEKETIPSLRCCKRRIYVWIYFLMIRQEYFYPQPCLARGLRAGVNALLTNADEGTRSTHLIKIEVFDLLFDATTRKLLTSTVSRGLRLGNVLLTNADEGIQSTHLIKIEVSNLQKLNKIRQNEH